MSEKYDFSAGALKKMALRCGGEQQAMALAMLTILKANAELNDELSGFDGVLADVARLEEENAALKDENARLAAELATYHEHKISLAAMMKALDVFFSDDEIGSPELGMKKAYEILRPKRSTATKECLAEIRAQAVEEFGNQTIAIGEEEKEQSIIYAGKQALLHAANIRAAAKGGSHG